MNLGIVQWLNGSTIHMLAERNVWSALSAITLMGCVFVGSLVELDLTIFKLDDGWPESVEEQGLLLLVWRRNIRNDI